jgi:8-oxo-dGTP diphosphatase
VLHYTEYDTRLGAYAVIIDTVDGCEQVLLALWNEPASPRWTLPGGGVELDETVEAGAVRELREETGYDVELGRLIGVDTFVVPVEGRTTGSDRPLRNVRVIFEARVVGGELTREVGGTTDEAQWFPVDEVPGLERVGLVDVGLGFALRSARENS